MKGGKFFFLWNYTALPILLVVAVIVAGGIYFQILAVDIQTRPIRTKVSPESGNRGSNDDLVFERPRGIDVIAVDDGPLADALWAMQDGDDDAGIAILTDLLSEQPDQIGDPRVGLTLAQAYIRVGRLADAESTLDKVSLGSGYDARVFFNLGLVKQRRGNPEGAIQDYRRAISARPTYYEATFNLGTLFLKIGRFDEAVIQLSDAVTLAGGQRKANALYNLGLAQGRSELYGKAEESFLTALKFAPTHLLSRVALAGIYRRNLNRLDDAESLFDEVLALDPSFGPAFTGLASIELDRGNPDLAEELLRESLSKDPNYLAAREDLARLLSDSGRLDEARRELEWIRDHTQDSMEATYLLGRLEYRSGNYEKAVEYYRESFELSGNVHVESLNNYGLAQKAAGKTEEARSAFLEAVQLNPEYAPGYYNLGLLEIDDDRLPNAEEAFIASVEIDPEYSEAWYNLGLVHSELGRPADAIRDYEESLRIQPSNIKARINLAVLYRRQGFPSRALEQYRLVLALNPTYSSAWYNMALLQKAEGRFSDAEESYTRAIDLDPDNEKYWNNLAVLYSNQGKIDLAIRLLVDALDVHPESDTLRYNLALQYKRQGDIPSALNELERLVSVAPNYVKAWISLGDTQSELDRHQEAISSFKTALKIDPEDPLTIYQLGKEYLALDRFEEAAQLFEEALESVRDNAWIWYNLGKTYQELDRQADAEEAYRYSLAIDPTMGRFIYNRLDRVEESIRIRREMVERNPADLSLRVNLAKQLRREGLLSEALTVVNEGLVLDASYVDLWLLFGDLQIELDEVEPAGDAYARAYRLDSDNAESAVRYGIFLLDHSRPEDAVPVLQRAASLSAEPFDVLRDLGDAYYALKNYSRAIEVYNQVKSIDPEHGRNLIDLGKAYYRAKDYDSALTQFNRAAELLPDYDWSHIWLARTYNRLDRPIEAENSFLIALEIDPREIQALIGLGDLAKAAGRLVQAADFYRRVLDLDPTQSSTRRKLDRLDITL